jgi:putative two-component system response regulator
MNVLHILNKFKVLIVDDSAINLNILSEALCSYYDISIAKNGKKALDLISQSMPDLILLDIQMPEMDGYKVCRILKNNPRTSDISIIFITSMGKAEDEEKGLALGAVDFITKPFNVNLVKARIDIHLELKLHRNKLEDLVEKRTKQLELAQEAVIMSLVSLAEFRNMETGLHIKRTQYYVQLLAEKLRNRREYTKINNHLLIKLLYKSAPLHDIGKVGIPDSILLKPKKLSFEERELMKTHVVKGVQAIESAEKIIGKISFLRYAKEIILTHHERWDGTGYPNRLQGKQIPITGRIMAVADVYDALTTKRVYKDKISHKEAMKVIIEEKGRHFAPEVVDALLELQNDFLKIRKNFPG